MSFSSFLMHLREFRWLLWMLSSPIETNWVSSSFSVFRFFLYGGTISSNIVLFPEICGPEKKSGGLRSILLWSHVDPGFEQGFKSFTLLMGYAYDTEIASHFCFLRLMFFVNLLSNRFLFFAKKIPIYLFKGVAITLINRKKLQQICLFR